MKMNAPLFIVGSLVVLAIAFALGYEFGQRNYKPLVHHLRPPPH